MERLLVIIFAATLGTGFYYWFSWMIKKESMRQYIMSHLWLLHPNAICYWRTAMALVGYFLYFFSTHQSIAIVIFTFAAILDGVDGIVARKCNLVSKWGESLDPLCDKLTYLPPLISFAYLGIMSPQLVWILVVVELFGQFFARKLLSYFNFSVAANNFGKIKAIIVDKLGVDEGQVAPETTFEELGADSLDLVELVMAFMHLRICPEHSAAQVSTSL